MTSGNHVKKRVNDQLGWYYIKNVRNKKGFIALQIIMAFAPAMPVSAIYSDTMRHRLKVAVFGSVTIIGTRIVSLFQFQIHWRKNRTASETLKHKKYLYQKEADTYTSDDSFGLWSGGGLKLFNQENTAWQQRL